MSDYLTVVYNEKDRPYTTYPQKLCNYIFNVFKMGKGMKLLEVGCGRGEHLIHFKNMGLDVHGVDVSPESVKYQPDIQIKIENIEKNGIPYDDNYFEIVYSKSFIEHLYYPENYIKEAYRVLKNGGLFLTLVPDWETNYKIYFDDYTHRTPFTKASLEDIYKIFGFEKVEVHKFRQLPIVWKYPVLNYFCAAISSFTPVRVKNKFLRWSRELMIIGSGIKPLNVKE
jgi:ubiquinone/menaquinone biosynthesis C-methylase UbiE